MPESSYVRENEPSHKFEFAEDVERELVELDKKGIDVNQELRRFLEDRKQYIHDEKERLGRLAEQSDSAQRYIPVEVRKILKEEYGKKCSMNGCTKPSVEIHHLQRFGYVRRHDPRFMAPLCREHHQIAPKGHLC